MQNQISKKRSTNFTIIQNDIFKLKISAKALGIFMYLWSLPNDWKFYETEITKHFKDGRDGVRSGIKELEVNGLLVKKRTRNIDGTFDKSIWQLNEKPQKNRINPHSENPHVDSPHMDKPTLQSTKEQSTKEQSTNKKHTSSSQSSLDQTTIIEIIDYLNKKTKKHFLPKSKSNQKWINARLRDGYTLDNFKQVIDTKSAQWLKDKKMIKYLRPKTLFNATNFEGYLNETPEQPSFKERNSAKKEISKGVYEDDQGDISW